MIVSHKYKYVFLKTYKTAGTSIEIALSEHCGERDIITPISGKDEEIRKERGYRGPQRHSIPYSRYTKQDWLNLFLKRKRAMFYNHISAVEVRRYIGGKIWNQYYKFCFERNPWDRVISHYYWRYKKEPRPSLSEFIYSDIPSLLKEKGIGLYTIDKKIVVDRVCRYEDLQKELSEVRNFLGIPSGAKLPHAKGNIRNDKRHYSELLNDNDRNHIANMFSDEISAFGYSY